MENFAVLWLWNLFSGSHLPELRWIIQVDNSEDHSGDALSVWSPGTGSGSCHLQWQSGQRLHGTDIWGFILLQEWVKFLYHFPHLQAFVNAKITLMCTLGLICWLQPPEEFFPHFPAYYHKFREEWEVLEYLPVLTLLILKFVYLRSWSSRRKIQLLRDACYLLEGNCWMRFLESLKMLYIYILSSTAVFHWNIVFSLILKDL